MTEDKNKQIKKKRPSLTVKLDDVEKAGAFAELMECIRASFKKGCKKYFKHLPPGVTKDEIVRY